MFPFSSKKPEQQRAYIPVDLVQRYASQGMPEAEIISRLKGQGFSPGQIDTSLRAVLRERVAGPSNIQRQQAPIPPQEHANIQEQFPSMQMIPKQTGEAIPMPSRRPPEQSQFQPQEQRPQQQEFQQRQSPEFQQQRPRQFQSQMEEPEEHPKFTFEANDKFEAENDITLEEVIEGVVAEKWQDFEQRLANFEERDLQLAQQIQDIRTATKDVVKLVESKEQNLSGRFEQFGDSMSSIEGRIGSIEKIFKDFVPELSKSMRTISEMVEKK
ncbi:MAG: hypothetical protein KJ697_04185 [Nanoarchaeota archaeon]|nr:hypothetical protein [Nanoarchaeota archaeon]